MKNIKLIITGLFITTLSFGLQAQPDPPGGGHGGGKDAGPAGGGAPLTSGLFILSGLVAAYAGKKTYDYKNKSGEIAKDL